MGIIAAKTRLRGHDKGHNHPPPPSSVSQELCQLVQRRSQEQQHDLQASIMLSSLETRGGAASCAGGVWNLLGGEMLMEHPC